MAENERARQEGQEWLEHAVLVESIALYPGRSTVSDVIRRVKKEHALKTEEDFPTALRELEQAGLLRRDGDAVEPTYAARRASVLFRWACREGSRSPVGDPPATRSRKPSLASALRSLRRLPAIRRRRTIYASMNEEQREEVRQQLECVVLMEVLDHHPTHFSDRDLMFKVVGKKPSRPEQDELKEAIHRLERHSLIRHGDGLLIEPTCLAFYAANVLRWQ